MKAYLVFVGCDTRHGDKAGVTYAENSDAAQLVADEQAEQSSPNMIGWVRYIGDAAAADMVSDGVSVI